MKTVSGKYFFLLVSALILVSGWSELFAQLYVTNISFEGNDHFSDSELKGNIETYEKGWLAKLLFWTDNPPFDESILQDDVNRLCNFYISEGYIHVQVNPEQKINGQNVEILFHVHENSPVRIANVQFNMDHSPETAPHPTPGIKPYTELDLVKGKRFTDFRFIADKQKLTDFYAESGYPYTEIQSDLKLDKDSLNMNYRINTGPLCFFGHIETSPIKIPRKVLQKQLTLNTGDPFSPRELQETQQKLYNLGVFQYVSINAQLDSSLGNTIPVNIQLKESPKFKTQFGFGYGKEDHFRVSAKVTRIGFLGSVRRLTLNAKHSYLEPYNLNLVWLHPAFTLSGTSLSVEPFLRKEREPGYEIRRYGLGMNVQNKISRYTNTFVRYALENDELYLNSISITELQEQTLSALYNKSSLTLGIIRDTSRPILVPETGSYYSLTYTLSGLNFNSQYHYQRFLYEARYYHRFFGIMTLALKTKWGAVSPWKSGETVPIEERFFAGGYTSIRGWARSRLGPIDQDGKPLGGVSLMENSVEFRLPFIPPLSAVLFMDFGNVWTTELTYDIHGWRGSPGMGLWMQSPIGPLRLDIAAPLPAEFKDIQYYFNVGHAF